MLDQRHHRSTDRRHYLSNLMRWPKENVFKRKIVFSQRSKAQRTITIWPTCTAWSSLGLGMRERKTNCLYRLFIDNSQIPFPNVLEMFDSRWFIGKHKSRHSLAKTIFRGQHFSNGVTGAPIRTDGGRRCH